MHIWLMRSHKQIVDEVGPGKLAAEFDLPLSTTRSWSRRNSIPAGAWHGFVSKGLATYEELAHTVAKPVAA